MDTKTVSCWPESGSLIWSTRKSDHTHTNQTFTVHYHFGDMHQVCESCGMCFHSFK